MVKTFPEQKLLIVVNQWGFALVIGAQGEGALQQCKDYSMFPEDLFESATRIPREPGFYLWVGELYIDDGQMSASEAVDPDIRWNGMFAQALTSEDIGSFIRQTEGWDSGEEQKSFSRVVEGSMSHPMIEVKDARGVEVKGFQDKLELMSDNSGIYLLRLTLKDDGRENPVRFVGNANAFG